MVGLFFLLWGKTDYLSFISSLFVLSDLSPFIFLKNCFLIGFFKKIKLIGVTLDTLIYLTLAILLYFFCPSIHLSVSLSHVMSVPHLFFTPVSPFFTTSLSQLFLSVIYGLSIAWRHKCTTWWVSLYSRTFDLMKKGEKMLPLWSGSMKGGSEQPTRTR